MKNSAKKILNFVIKNARWKPEDYVINSIYTVITAIITLFFLYTAPRPYTFIGNFYHMLPLPFIFAIMGMFRPIIKNKFR